MRILHTGDWHLGDRLGSQKRERHEDLGRALAQIARYLDEHRVDVMLVAGDLFSEYCRSHERIRQAVGQIREHFGPFLARGGTLVAISGNHDDGALFETLGHALELVPLARPTPGKGIGPAGRPYLFAAPRRHPLRLAGQDGSVVQFVPLPYPSPRYLPADVRFTSRDERSRAIQERFRRVLQEASKQIDETLPAVLVSHIAIRGVPVRHERCLTESEEILFEPADISGRWSYAAYGHIHAPGLVGSKEHVRYCGSIERLDAGETEDKSVVLVEVLPGVPCQPVLLPLETTPVHRITVRDPETDLPRLTEEIHDRERALVHYTLHYDPTRHNRDAICREIEEIFPRWYDRAFVEEGSAEADGAAFTPRRLEDVAGTVQAFLSENVAADDPDREALFLLAERFLLEMEAAP
jgi:exonuclease SbcD